MLIPVKGRSIQLFNFSIGQQNDNNIEHLVFEIPRFYGDIDLSDGIIYALFQYPSKTTDYTVLRKEVQETKILATWIVGKSVLAENGVLHFQLKISNLISEIWHSETAYFQVSSSIPVETPEPVSRKARMASADTEPPITVSERNIHIPSALRSIAVQNDENSETVGILMPRYFDGHDLSKYSIVLKTVSVGGRDDIVLFPISTSENEIKLQWTLRPPQTSYTGTLNLQIYVIGDNFKWETAATSVNIITSLDAKPVVPSTPSILDSFIKEVSALVDQAKQAASTAKDYEIIVKTYADTAAENAAISTISKIAAKESEKNAGNSAEFALSGAETATTKATEAVESAAGALASKESAEGYENTATEQATLATEQGTKAKSYAVGGTGSRENEDTDNSKYYSTAAKSHKDDAAVSAETAVTKAGEADASAVDALDSKSKAATSAETAITKAGEAVASAEEAFLQANRAKSEADRASAIVGNLGWFATPEDLKSAYPIGQNGWFATIGTTDSLWVWDRDTFAWVDSQNKGGGDYNLITNKPQLNGVTLVGDTSLADVGVQAAGDYATTASLTAGLETKQPVGDYATNAALETVAAGKADKATTLAGYSITDGTTKIEVDTTVKNAVDPIIAENAWGKVAAPEANGWLSVCYGNGLFVAVAYSGTNRIMTSPDGITWTARPAPEANDWYSVCYGNGLFVAVAYNGTNCIMTSPDGITWTARLATEANNWYSVCYGNGLFVAVAYSGTNRIMTSPDGITWTARLAPEANSWRSVCYGNGLFVAVAYDGTNRIMTSPDGITWTARLATEANNWYSVCYGNGLFVAVAYSGTNRIMLWSTVTDLRNKTLNLEGEINKSWTENTWTARLAPETNQWRFVCHGNGLFVAVANTGTNRIMTSPDGITWTKRPAPEANSWLSVCYGNGLFVAVSNSGTNRIMTSPDGITWTKRPAPEANGWYSICYENGLFVAVAYNGTNCIMTSPDGITWTARPAPEANEWRSVCYGNGLFVAVAASGTNRIMTSPDGITWTARPAPEANYWFSVCYGNGLFVAVAYSGTNRIMTSPDGITWTARPAPEANDWYSVCYGNGLFVAVATNGTNRIMTSPDGITWTKRPAPEANYWHSVCYGNGLFVAVAAAGTNNRIMTCNANGGLKELIYNLLKRVDYLERQLS